MVNIGFTTFVVWFETQLSKWMLMLLMSAGCVNICLLTCLSGVLLAKMDYAALNISTSE